MISEGEELSIISPSNTGAVAIMVTCMRGERGIQLEIRDRFG